MRISDPQVRIVVVYRLNSDFHSVFTLQETGRDFQHGSVDLSSRGKVYSRHVHWLCKLQEFVSVLRHEVLSDFNFFQEFCISKNLYQLIWL